MPSSAQQTVLATTILLRHPHSYHQRARAQCHKCSQHTDPTVVSHQCKSKQDGGRPYRVERRRRSQVHRDVALFVLGTLHRPLRYIKTQAYFRSLLPILLDSDPSVINELLLDTPSWKDQASTFASDPSIMTAYVNRFAARTSRQTRQNTSNSTMRCQRRHPTPLATSPASPSSSESLSWTRLCRYHINSTCSHSSVRRQQQRLPHLQQQTLAAQEHRRLRMPVMAGRCGRRCCRISSSRKPIRGTSQRRAQCYVALVRCLRGKQGAQRQSTGIRSKDKGQRYQDGHSYGKAQIRRARTQSLPSSAKRRDSRYLARNPPSSSRCSRTLPCSRQPCQRGSSRACIAASGLFLPQQAPVRRQLMGQGSSDNHQARPQCSVWYRITRDQLLALDGKGARVDRAAASFRSIVLTLDILKHAKRFHATVSFLADTGLKDCAEKVHNYNLLMKDFPINELLSATDLDKCADALSAIFNHLNKKLRISPYPVKRALPLVEAISRDLNETLLKVLASQRIMWQEFRASGTQYRRQRKSSRSGTSS